MGAARGQARDRLARIGSFSPAVGPASASLSPAPESSLRLVLAVGRLVEVLGDGGDRPPVERDDDPGGDLDPELALAGLADDRVHAAGGDDLVALDDLVLHRRVCPLAAAPGHREQEPAAGEEDDDDDYRSDAVLRGARGVALEGGEGAALDRLAGARGQVEQEA